MGGYKYLDEKVGVVGLISSDQHLVDVHEVADRRLIVRACTNVST